jgi:basic membrane protein A and related proteins
MDGTWASHDFWGGMAEDVIRLTPINERVPADIAEEAMRIAASIEDGSFHPFTGPLTNQAGEVVVPEGVIMTNEELAGMNWYVGGIKAALPN